MKVLIVVPWDQERGGVATVVNNLARYLVERGDDALFLHPGESERPISKLTRAGFRGVELNLRSPSVREHPVRSRIAFWLLLPRTILRLRNLIRAHRIDLVNIHYPLESFVYFALTRLLLGHRLVVSVHGNDLMPNGEPMSRYPAALRWLLRGCDRLTAPSAHYLESVLREFPELRARAAVVHNGIDPGEFRGAGQSGAPGARGSDTILCIAAHNPKKGLDTLITALSLLRRGGTELGLTLVGDGPLRGELEALAERLGVRDLVHFTGFLDLQEVNARLRRCEIFVLPSRAEPFGIVIIEALIHGKPVIATRVGGIPEIVDHLENGYLVPPEDPHSLARAILELHGDAALRDRLGRAGVATVLERFTLADTGAKFESIFSDLVRRSDERLRHHRHVQPRPLPGNDADQPEGYGSIARDRVGAAGSRQ